MVPVDCLVLLTEQGFELFIRTCHNHSRRCANRKEKKSSRCPQATYWQSDETASSGKFLAATRRIAFAMKSWPNCNATTALRAISRRDDPKLSFQGCGRVRRPASWSGIQHPEVRGGQRAYAASLLKRLLDHPAQRLWRKTPEIRNRAGTGQQRPIRHDGGGCRGFRQSILRQAGGKALFLDLIAPAHYVCVLYYVLQPADVACVGVADKPCHCRGRYAAHCSPLFGIELLDEVLH